MHKILRTTVFNSLSLFFLTLMLPGGIKIGGGIITYILGGFILAIFSIFVKPIINVISLPLNLVSLGLFSFLINAAILYVLTVLLPSITIHAFVFEGANYGGFIIPKIHFNSFFAYVFTATLLSVLDAALSWITKK